MELNNPARENGGWGGGRGSEWLEKKDKEKVVQV